jgi:hypothetical protein
VRCIIISVGFILDEIVDRPTKRYPNGSKGLNPMHSLLAEQSESNCMIIPTTTTTLAFVFLSLQIISYNSPRGGVTVVTEKGETTTSYLLIQQAKPTDSGRYSCNKKINSIYYKNVLHLSLSFENILNNILNVL